MSDRSFLHHNIGSNPNGMPEQILVGFVNVNQSISTQSVPRLILALRKVEYGAVRRRRASLRKL